MTNEHDEWDAFADEEVEDLLAQVKERGAVPALRDFAKRQEAKAKELAEENAALRAMFSTNGTANSESVDITPEMIHGVNSAEELTALINGDTPAQPTGLAVRNDAEEINADALNASLVATARSQSKAANPYGGNQTVAGLPPAGIGIHDAMAQADSPEMLTAVLKNAHRYKGGVRNG